MCVMLQDAISWIETEEDVWRGLGNERWEIRFIPSRDEYVCMRRVYSVEHLKEVGVNETWWDTFERAQQAAKDSELGAYGEWQQKHT